MNNTVSQGRKALKSLFEHKLTRVALYLLAVIVFEYGALIIGLLLFTR